jgi:hypothetical protein
VFTVLDNPGGVGVDRSTVEAFLDGESITSELKGMPDGAFRFDLKTPLAPCFGLRPIARWQIENYGRELTIQVAAPRGPGGGPSISVGRAGARADTAFALVSPQVSVREGATYCVAYWSRHAMRLGAAGSKPGQYASGITWFDTDGKPVGPPVPFDFGDANPAWHQDQRDLVAPPGARWAEMRFGWDGPDLCDGTTVEFTDPRFDGPHPIQGSRPNLHQVTVRAADFAGNTLVGDWWIFVQGPPAEGAVTVRDDCVILVDGKPLFPIGIYSVWKREHNENDFEKCFAELAAAGFNTVHTYTAARTPEMDEFYAVAHRHGIKIIIAPRTGANNDRPEAVVQDVATEACRPALLAWYLADDTASHISAERLRQVHQTVKDIDPFHITVQADGVFAGVNKPSRYAAYVDSTDALLPELYPIHSDANDEVADIIRDMKAIAGDFERAGHRRPVWAIIQDFQGWGWQRYPTNAEVRAMTYLAIIHGATGMTYYTYGGHGDNHGATHDPQVWANLKRIVGQLAALHDVLVEPTGPQTQRVEIAAGAAKDRLGYPAVSTLLKQHAGRSYLLAANSAEATVRAKLTVEKAGRVVDVMFEDRKVDASSGTFNDEFGPYAVHVYAW